MSPFEPYYVHPLCDLVAARIRIGLPLQGIMLRETDVARFTQTPFLRDNLPVELIRTECSRTEPNVSPVESVTVSIKHTRLVLV
jgi:hypothetical protein